MFISVVKSDHMLELPAEPKSLRRSKLGRTTGIYLFESAQAAITKFHRLGRLNNRYSFLIVLEARKSKISVLCQSVSFLVRALLLVCKWLTSYCVLIWEREREITSVSLLVRALIPFLRV